jgi:hypothetical protein
VEHRWGQRRAVNTPARIHVDTRIAVAARLLDFSLSGGFIETTLELIPLARLLLEIDSPESGTADVLRIGAFVVRRAGRGYGIEWHSLATGNLPTAWVQAERRDLVPAAHTIPRGSGSALSATPQIR